MLPTTGPPFPHMPEVEFAANGLRKVLSGVTTYSPFSFWGLSVPGILAIDHSVSPDTETFMYTT